MRRELGGDRFWWLNMVLCGEVGARVISEAHGVGLWKYICRGW
jgi:hypothetical protein